MAKRKGKQTMIDKTLQGKRKIEKDEPH